MSRSDYDPYPAAGKNRAGLVKDDDGVYRIYDSYRELCIGTVGRSASTVDYAGGPEAVRGAEKDLLQKITGIARPHILALNQVHGDAILFIDSPRREERLIDGEADGFITTLPGTCIVIRTADCVPVFAYDPENHVLGAAHSGWKGTRLAVAGKLVREMRRLAGSSFDRLLLYILPSIGPESYEVGSDVGDLFPGDTVRKNGSIRLDLWRAIGRSLAGAGIPEGNIYCAGRCTLGERSEFFSHRGGDRGRNLNFGFMKRWCG